MTPDPIAGYTPTADLGPCPGGRAFAARHPADGRPVVVRRLRPDGDPDAFARRTRAAVAVAHPHLARLLDAGADAGGPFAVLEPADGAPLDALVRDIGPMPVALAVRYAAQAAAGLAAAHAAGLAHGDVCAANLVVGPLVESGRVRADGSPVRRPAADAVATVSELGLVPRPPGRPEPTPADDVAGLGTALFHLLVGSPPVRPGVAADLAAARPDAPPGLVALLGEMTADDPAARPPMAAVAGRLVAIAQAPPPAPAGPDPTAVLPEPGVRLPPPPAEVGVPPTEPPPGWVLTPYDGPSTENKFTLPDYPSGGGRSGEAFVPPPSSESPRPRRPKTMTAEERQRLRRWLLAGAGLWLLTIPLWLLLLSQRGCFGGTAEPPASQPGKRR
jgi:hypothetical protein